MEQIRWGIAGPGMIANKFAKAVQNVEGAELVAVAARSAEKGRAFAEKHGIAHVFGSFEEMAASELVDAVYVSTPHPVHQSCAEVFLRGGKHVLCEKPICVNAGQARQLKTCAKEQGVFLMEAIWTRFLPAIKTLQTIIASGEIGQVMGLEADFCYATTPEEEGKLFLNNMAGGSVMDVGIYGLNLAALLLGTQTEDIRAFAHVSDGVDLHTQMVLKYPNGAMASVTSAIALRKPETAYVYGTKGYVCLPTFYGAQELIINTDGTDRRIPMPSMGDGFEEEICEVCSCIRAGKKESEIMPLDESIRILEWMDEIRKKISVQYPFD